MEEGLIKGQIHLRNTHDGSFAWQGLATTKYIRSRFTGKKRATAIAIYQALSECACEEGRRKGYQLNIFPATLKYLAEKSGKSESTIKRYAQDFKALGILDWDCRKRGEYNLANVWKLLRCPAHYGAAPSLRNGELPQGAHNSELVSEERARRYITKKGRNNNFERGRGLRSVADDT